MDNPSVVVGHLSDEEIKKSITAIVNAVDEGAKDMAKKFDDQIKVMEQSFNRLKNLKADFGESSGSSRRSASSKTKQETQAVKEQTQAVKEQTQSYDALAQAQQKAVGVKSARESYIAFMQGYKAQGEAIAKQIQDAESALNKAVETRTNELTTKLDAAKRKLNELYSTLYAEQEKARNAGTLGMPYNAGITRTEQAIEYTKKHIEELNAAIAKVSPNMFTEQVQQIEQLRARRERVLDTMKEEVTTQQQSAQVETQQLNIDTKRTEELQKQIGLIQSRGDAKKTFENAAAMPVDTYEQAQEKLRVLESLKEKVANTPLFSKNQTQALGDEIEKARVKMSFLYRTTEEGVAKEKARVAAQQKLMQDRLVQIEKEKAALKERGLAAQQSANAIRESMRDQMQDNMATGTQQAISGLKDLQQHIRDMQRAYGAMNQEEVESPIGRALKNDIRLAREAMVAVSKYNLSAVTGRQTPIEGLERFDSYKLLSQRVSRLTKEYKDLTAAERDAEKGKGMAEKIQLFSRALQEIQRQMSRPISLKNALGLEENTLDRIAYKIQQLNAYKMGLKLTDPNQVAEMRKVDDAVSRLKKDYDNLMAKNSQLMSSNNALARSWNYMKNRLVFYFTVGASTQFVKNLIEVRSQYEMNERALGILIDSAERGTQIFNELSQMALVSPYTLIELSSAAKQLTAYDVAAKDVVDTTRRLADMASAVGIPIERLTYALGQIKAYGYLNSRDARMFLNAGIPLVKNLADHYTELEGKMVSVGDVYDRMKKKAIGYNDVMQVITEMTDEGGRFFDFQAKMADTLKVQLANLTLAWNNMLNEIGKSEQGVLVGGIKGLKELFLQWENISKAIRNVAWVLGIVKAAQLVYYFAVRNSNNAIALHNVLGNKMSRNLKEIAVGFRNAKNAITGASAAMKTFVLTTIAIAAIATAVVELAMAWKDAEEGVKNFNKTIRDGAAENYKNITNTLEQYKDLRESLYEEEERGGNNVRVAQDIDESNAKKAWESIREEIELSSAASETYISRLMQIDNVSERLRQGFVLLDDLQAVNSALSEMGDKTIFIQQDWSSWWNLWLAPDSFEENLRDFIKAKKQIEDAYGDIETAREKLEKASSVGDKNLKSGVSRYDNTLEQFRENLKETTDSIIDFISLKGWTGDTNKINELFAQFTNKTVMQLGLDPSEAFTLQLEVEQARAKAAKQSLQIRLEDEKQALKAARDEETKEAIQANIDRLQTELNDFDENNGRGRVLWENYTKWMKEQHMSEMTQMFRDMDEEDIKSINFQEGKWKEFAERTAMQYAKEHKISYNDAFNLLQNWVKNANKWSIFIPLTISTESGKSVYEQLGEYDKIIDDADSQIKRLTTRIGELQAKQKLSKEEAKELADAQNELAQAERDKADAEAKGGHGKQESKDAKNATKAQKQAESELQKALKDELSLLDKVRSQYKKLTDAGVDGTTALNMVTNQFTNSIQRINNILGRNGLPLFNIKAFAGTDNPNAVLGMLKKQLDAANVAKNIKPSEIKELEVKYGEIVIDAKVYNTKKITDGLNNELSKLKDEYELAVELDADPEMGSAFAQLFDIDTNQLPKNLEDYAKRATEILNRYFKDDKIELPTINLTDDDLKAYKAILGESKYKILESFTKDYKSRSKKEAQDIVKQTKDLQYKLGDVNEKIAIESKKLADLQVKYQKETNDEKKRLLDLQIKDQENAIKELQSQALVLMPEYKKVFGNIAEYSANVARKLQNDLRSVYDNAKYDPKTGQYELVGSDGKPVFLDKEQYTKEYNKLNKELQKTKSNFQKIKEAFKPSDKDGVVDYAKGIELVAEEAKKAADGLHTVADIVSYIGGSDDAVEVLNDVATSIEGVATAGQGIAQIASGDYIGGAVNVLKGTWQAVSTWFDNSDKRISNEIANSERQVRRLELAYIDLEHAINDAYGTETIGAQKAAIANKELQLAELKRQLTLEQSRKKKNQDQDRIIELQKQIKELEYDIKNMTNEIVNDLLGISSVGDAMESLMDGFVEALRSGEDAMKVFDESIDDMIANMVKKMFTTKILQPWFEQQWDLIQKDIDERVGKEMPKKIAELTGQVDTAKRANLNNRDSVWEALASMGLSAEQIHQYESYDAAGEYIWDASKRFERRKELYEKMLDDKEKELDAAQREYTELTTPTVDDIKKWAVLLRSGDITVEQWQGYLDGLLTDLDLMKDSKDKTLSNLQQGIRGVTEETAGAIESYLNGMSQQVYLHSDLLVQIRDAVVAMDSDAQIGVQAQMLLQLQQSYAIQVAIQGILAGWSNPSGLAVRVEMV